MFDSESTSHDASETPAISASIAERGAAMVEYALLLAMLAIVAIGAITAFGGGLGDEYDDINNEITETIDEAQNGGAGVGG